MKTTIILIVISFLFLAVPLSGQEPPIINKKSLHEISIQPIGFIAYSYLKDISHKFVLGINVGIGFGAIYRIQQDNGWKFNSWQLSVFTRNLLRSPIRDYRFIYDIGIFASTDYMLNGDEFNKRFGMNIRFYYRMGKFKIGTSFRVSTESILTENQFEYPKFEIIPILVAYQF